MLNNSFLKKISLNELIFKDIFFSVFLLKIYKCQKNR